MRSRCTRRWGQKKRWWQGKDLVMETGRKAGSGQAEECRQEGSGSPPTQSSPPAQTPPPRLGRRQPRGVGKQETGAMIRKGFFGAAPPSQQVPCDLRPSRLSVHPSVHPSPYPDSTPGSTRAIGGTKKDRNHHRGSQTIAGTRNEPLQTVP